MLQQRKSDDFVIATNTQHSVREFAKMAFSIVGLDYKKYVKIDKSLYRPAEVQTLLGDFSKARKLLKWKPKVSFKNLVKDMVLSDLEFVRKNQVTKIKGVNMAKFYTMGCYRKRISRFRKQSINK